MRQTASDKWVTFSACTLAFRRRLLHTSVSPPSSLCPGSVQETTQLQIKAQQAESAKALVESMNKDLQVIILSHIILLLPRR